MCLTDLRQRRRSTVWLQISSCASQEQSCWYCRLSYFVSLDSWVLVSRDFRLHTPCVCPSRCGTIWPDSWCSEVWGEDNTLDLWTEPHSPSSQISSSLGRTGVWVWSPASGHPCIWSSVLFWCTCTCRLLRSGSIKPPLTKVAPLCTDACLHKYKDVFFPLKNPSS